MNELSELQRRVYYLGRQIGRKLHMQNHIKMVRYFKKPRSLIIELLANKR